MKNYDIVIVGAGVAGYAAAIRAASYGKNVALVEKNATGGTCVNKGCIPTKALLHISERYNKAISASSLTEYIEQATTTIRRGMMTTIQSLGIDYYNAQMTGTGNLYIEINADGGIRLGYNKLVLAMGAEPIIPDNLINCDSIITTDEILKEENILPEKLVILGGGVIGIELASLYADVGVKVTVIESGKRILNNFSRELSNKANAHLQKKGVRIITNAVIGDVSGEDGEVCAVVRNLKNSKEEEVLCDKILVCVGRKSVIDQKKAEILGLEWKNGRIITDEYYRTSNPNVYAVGDVNGQIQLAYTSEMQAEIACDHICEISDNRYAIGCVPVCVFMDMEVAQLGISSDEARENDRYELCSISAKADSMAVIKGKTEGYCSLIVNKEDDRLMGIELFCPNAVDIIGGMTMMIRNGVRVNDILTTLFPHPSFVEIIKLAARKYAIEKVRKRL